MNTDDFYQSRYLKASDLNGQAHTVEISRVEAEDLGDPQKPDRKPVLYFKDKEKGLVCNKTNAMSIAARFGKDMHAWIGSSIELFAMMVQGPSGPVEGIRVRPLEKTQPAPQAKAQF